MDERIDITINGTRRIRAERGANLLKTLRSAGVYFSAVCGGRGVCGKCAVRAVSGFPPVSSADEAYFTPEDIRAGWRLACAAFPDSALDIAVLETGEERFSAVTDFEFDSVVCALEERRFSPEKSPVSFARQIKPEGGLTLAELRQTAKLAEVSSGTEVQAYYDQGRIIHIGTERLSGIAVDVGTTTIAFAAVDLRTGSILGRFSAVNRQREYGADVITRIQRANEDCLGALSLCVREQIAEGVAALRSSADIGIPRKIAVAGNTAMLHLLLGLSCKTLGISPFTPVTVDIVTMRYCELFSEDFDCEVVLLPGISAYIGADITAGVFFADMRRSTVPAAFMDIGTNGEMALMYGGKLLCAATAAGPAFEGGNIFWGIGSVPGAIARVTFRNGGFAAETIGNLPPIGICGSGIVDTVYQGLINGFIQRSGKFAEGLREIMLARHSDGRDIVFTQKDVRELQLGKSAVRSGFDALLNRAGIGYEDVQVLHLAGGFGFNLNLASAAGIGLIPEPLIPKVRLIGNSALGGAVKYLLNPYYADEFAGIAENAEEWSLPADSFFNERFIANLPFNEF
ncbi:MAG: ASKHA domain-containing protein [Spirochaetaceae bacterium]|jgi:uncharacterized 2Fe-2S/4Fe-4S cluster protein (DUF4445 family)|nr:ASKHA domain-containing protein [Spirochaetaceae bacterium]